MSNIEVARRILGPEEAIRPAFVWLPLDLTTRTQSSRWPGSSP